MNLPPELSSFSILRHIQQKNSREWSAECPRCGESGHNSRNGPPDRFFMTLPNGNGLPAAGKCRQCGYFVTASWFAKLNSLPAPTMTERPIQVDEDALRRQKQIVDDLPVKASVYHSSMTDAHRRMWESIGFDHDAQDRWNLGFVTDKLVKLGEDKYYFHCMTIPIIGVNGHLGNMHYRLIDHPADVKKYRYEYGIPQVLFVARRCDDAPCIIVEGAKKAMYLALASEKAGDKVSIVSVPSKESYRVALQALDINPQGFIVALDPDANVATVKGSNATPPSLKMGQEIANHTDAQCQVVKLIDKPDDMLARGLCNWDQLRDNFFRNARVVWPQVYAQ